MKPPLFTYTVAPLTVLPFKKTLFSYGYDQEIPLGSIVTIPLSGRVIPGVVIALAPPTNTTRPNWLKNILSIENRAPLTKEQLALAQSVSEINFTPLGKVLKHFVPKQAKMRTSPSQKTSLPPLSFPASQEITAILSFLQTADTVFIPLTTAAKNLLTLGALLKKLTKKKGEQILILVPDIAAAVRLEKAWAAYFPENMVGLYHTKTSGQYFEAWKKIQEGTAEIIIATRHGMFAPFVQLRTIIQLDPSDEAYKQWDMSPRYHTQFVLPVLQTLWGAQLIQIAPLPSLLALKEKYPILTLPHTALTPEWVNLKIERWQKNWGVFAAPTQEAIRQALADKKQIILSVHQSGLASFSVCTECRTIFRCPSCGSVLKLTSSDHYQCSHCSFRSSLFPQCPGCKNIHFKNVGYGTEKVAKEIQKIFPGAQVAIMDKKHLEDHKKIAAFLEKTTLNEPDIIVTTDHFFRFPPLSQVALVAIIDADTLLNLPGYRKDEQFLELIERAKGILIPGGRLLAQTYHPHSDIFQKIDAGDPLAFLQNLLKEREEFRYPPYYRALTLEARPKKKDGDTLLRNASKQLKEIASHHPRKKELLVQVTTRLERGKSKPYTLLRYQSPLPPEIITFLSDQADTVFIDHDPLHIT